MNRVQRKFICDALDYEHRLDEWERKFINDLAEKPETYELSKKQNSRLNQIQQKIQD